LFSLKSVFYLEKEKITVFNAVSEFIIDVDVYYSNNKLYYSNIIKEKTEKYYLCEILFGL
jgi:hypothetical protein